MVMVSSSMAIFLATFSLNPGDEVLVDRVDLIEINHYFDEKGKQVFDQIIFYDWSPHESRFQVRDWRMLKRPAQIPHRDWQRNNFVAIWHDPLDGDVLRRVQAASLRETWTRYDPELTERQFLPKNKRRKLQKRSLPVTSK
ncbi:MAG: hypothetical protein MK165_11705 [Pirellulaceae bacterium]|nr:hypothetical protein [Pirellulaceae bacterium]